MKKLIYMTDDYSRGIYDGDTGELIHVQQHDSDLYFLLHDLSLKWGFELETKSNGAEEFPDKI